MAGIVLRSVSKIQNKGFKRPVWLAANKLNYWIKREWDYFNIHPIDALFFLTYRCTSRCKICQMWQRDIKGIEMGLDGWQRAVDMCYEVGVRWIEIFGGDALLRKDILVPLVEYIKGYPGMNCNMPTNCNLMDKETAEGLVRAGIDDIWISIDGVDTVHDAVRGKEGSFSKVVNGINYLLKARDDKTLPKIRANCTISKYNVHSFERILPFAEERGLDTVHLEYVGEFWKETLDKCDFAGTKPTPYFIKAGEETILVNEEEAYLIKKKTEMMKKQAEGMKVRLYTENIDKLTVENMVKGRFNNKRCYIMRFKVTVDPSGFILACPFYDGWKIGNVQEQHLRDIWKNEKHKKFIKAFKQGRFQFCNYCILGVQRNPTLFQDMRDELNAFFKKPRI